jgi:hypothetical protein
MSDKLFDDMVTAAKGGDNGGIAVFSVVQLIHAVRPGGEAPLQDPTLA